MRTTSITFLSACLSVYLSVYLQDAFQRTLDSYNLSGDVKLSLLSSEQGSFEHESLLGSRSAALHAPKSANITLCLVKPHVLKVGHPVNSQLKFNFQLTPVPRLNQSLRL